jgi:hypothetical protein
MRSALAAALTANEAFNVLCAMQATLLEAQKVAVDSARNFLIAAKSALANTLGRQWSAAWLPAGFTGGKLRIPNNVAEQQALVEAIGKYLRGNPDKEVEVFDVAASQAAALFETLKNARAAVSAGNSALSAAKDLRKEKEQELRWRFSGLIAELGLLLYDEDPACRPERRFADGRITRHDLCKLGGRSTGRPVQDLQKGGK